MLRLSFSNVNRHNEELSKFFNSGKFASTNYKRMWHLRLDKGWRVIYVGSPNFVQLWKAAWAIWNGIDDANLEVDRANHPVLMNIYDVRPTNLTPIAENSNQTYYKRED